MWSPFNSKRRKARRALISEAERRGMTVKELGETLTTKELANIIENALPQPDLTPWGLVPRAALIDAPSSGIPSIDAATVAAARGDWKPAAELLATSYGEWDLRACAVDELGRIAADDDGWLTAWRAASPDDKHTAVVDCSALTALAWQLRGSARAAETSAEQFAGFKRVLPEAEAGAKRAVQALPDDPTPWSTLVTLARALRYDHAQFDQVWQGVIKRAPLHRRAHESALQYWCAKWHGSHELMFDVADRAAALSPSLSVLVVRAAFEKNRDDPKVWRQQNVQNALDTLLSWLDADGVNSIDVRNDLGWTAMALVESGRGEEAIPVFKRLGTYAGGLPWSYYASPANKFNDYRIRACKTR